MLDAGHGRDRDALPPGRLARARRRRDGHRLAQPEGLHRGQAGPRGRAGALRRRRDRRRPRARSRPGSARAARRRLASRRSTSRTTSARTRSSFIDPATVRPMKVVVDGGNGMAGPMVGPILERLGLELEEMYFEPDGEFPDHEPNPLLEENRRLIIDRVRDERRRPRDRLGRRRRPLLLHRRRAASSATATSSARCSPARRWPRSPGATILYDPRSSRAVPDTGRRERRPLGPHPRRPRLLQGADARGRARPSAARSPATTTSATSGAPTRGRSRRCWCSSCSRSTAAALAELMARVPLAVLHLRRDQLRGRRPGGEDGGDRRALLRRRDHAGSTASRSTTPTGTSTSAPRTPSRCCASTSSRWSPARTWRRSATRSWALIRA